MAKSRFKAEAVLFVVLLGLCSSYNLSFATPNTTTETQKYPDYSYTFNGDDKFEGFNRKMFTFNNRLNKYLVKPVNILWASILPKCAMERLKGCYTNIEYPQRMVSSLLQKDFKTTGKETARFVINSTIGLGGMFDPAKSKFHIEESNKDMEQAFSKLHAKKGPYLVLPFAAPSNIRGYLGKLFDCGLNPTTYLMGVGPIIAKAGFTINQTSYAQSLIKAIDEGFADPYDISKKLYGIDNYIKNTGLDQKDVSAKIVDEKQLETEDKSLISASLKPDILMKDFAPQGPVVDSIRTAFFDIPNAKKSKWNELSVWNRSFEKKMKSSTANIDAQRKDYKFRYILQKNKKAPIAIVYPSIAESAFSYHPVVFAKMLYDSGYSVIVQGSAFHWEFIKSAPKDFKPGLPYRDAQYARLMTAQILKNLEKTKHLEPCGKIVIGTSYGAVTALFVGAEEDTDNTLGVSKYIAISPPVDLFYALQKLDLYAEECKRNGSELPEKTALTAEKLIQVYKELNSYEEGKVSSLPLSEDEGIIATNFIMRQKLSDLIFTIEGVSPNKKSDFYKKINDMSYDDYLQKYLMKTTNKSTSQLNYEMSLHSIEKFLSKSDKYKIYEAKDDYFTSKNQLEWLKKLAPSKVVLLQNGSHLGFLYRKEFQDALKEDILTFKPTGVKMVTGGDVRIHFVKNN